MNKFQKIGISVFFSTALMACQTTGTDQYGKNKADPFSQSGQMACAVGGIIGGVIGLLINSSHDNDPALGLAVGASLGCGAGVGGNYLLERERVSYRNQEDALAAETRRLKQINQISTEIVSQTQATINSDRRKIDKLNRDIAAKRASSARIRQEKRELDANIQEMESLVKTLENERTASVQNIRQARAAKLNTAQADAQRRILDGKIAKQKKLIAIAKRNRSAIKA
ncbi:putative lipoprotein [Taylorella asinigenitalis 14/45]|uniref:Putative lipoprotein n=1 Tax=Taylorella asinigenitalis 14/45 TaxID=1091495 RepID=I7IKE8_9BURK|nr:putative lipoprotein [Taylorella asinigenitalis]CCG19137.1 putative lipoprotein [Taylorella asinigenitalis 14/45]